MSEFGTERASWARPANDGNEMAVWSDLPSDIHLSELIAHFAARGLTPERVQLRFNFARAHWLRPATPEEVAARQERAVAMQARRARWEVEEYRRLWEKFGGQKPPPVPEGPDIIAY